MDAQGTAARYSFLQEFERRRARDGALRCGAAAGQGGHLAAARQGTARPPAAAPLTERQREVLQRVARGQTDKQVARDLSLSPRTVEMHIAGAMKALEAKSRAEAVRKATEQGQLTALR